MIPGWANLLPCASVATLISPVSVSVRIILLKLTLDHQETHSEIVLTFSMQQSHTSTAIIGEENCCSYYDHQTEQKRSKLQGPPTQLSHTKRTLKHQK